MLESNVGSNVKIMLLSKERNSPNDSDVDSLIHGNEIFSFRPRTTSDLQNKQVQKVFQQEKICQGFCLFIFVVLGLGFFGFCLFGVFLLSIVPLPGREAANMVAECEGSPVCFSFRYSGEQQ